MLQRAAIAAVLVCGAVAHLHDASRGGFVVPQIIDAGAGMLLLVGLWTPVVGAIVAARELSIMFSGGDLWMPLVLATFGGTLAMIGPGAWSIDARLFGRRQIKRLR